MRKLLLIVVVLTLPLLPVTLAQAPDDPVTPPAGEYHQYDSYELADSPVELVPEPAKPRGNNSTLLWGYEAAFDNSRLLAYRIGPPTMYLADCVPSGPNIPPDSNGRGVAFDPLDGNLWITRLTLFIGDGMIHKVSPPNVSPGICPEIKTLVLHTRNPHQVVQPDIGALDVDETTKHLWAAGYFPVSVGGSALRNYFYLVNRNSGLIIQSCWIPIFDPLPFNESLSVYRATDLPGSSKYLVTDGGVVFGRQIKVIDQASCHNGQEATVVATFTIDHGMTGMDFEYPGLLNTDLANLWNNGNKPFMPGAVLGSMAPSGSVEDVSLCGFRAKFGGGGNDMCPY